MRIQWAIGLGIIGVCGICNSVWAEPMVADRRSVIASPASAAKDLNLPPTIVSPTLEKWHNQIPNVKTDIATDPAFRTRLRLGYESFGDRSTNPTGWQLGLEDLRLGTSRATFNAHYRSNSTGRDRDLGADVNYSLMPLGKKFQLAPTIGYRHLAIENNATTGLNLGLRTRLILSRRSGADITFDQSWVAPGSDRETGLSRLSFGYAITKNMRIATDWQRQRSSRRKDDRFGLAVEWMP
jgi:hypothetical protein